MRSLCTPRSIAAFAATSVMAMSVMASTAFADIRVEFDEGAPKDRFTISNLSSCALQQGQVLIDLSKSKAGLIFDTTGNGAGVEVFQPLEFTRGQKFLTNKPSVKDGDNRVLLAFRNFDAGSSISFTIDVDDTIGQREITVSGAEIEGAAFTYKSGSVAGEAFFNASAVAQLSVKGC